MLTWNQANSYPFIAKTSVEQLFAPNSSLGEQIKSAYMLNWALLGMTAVKGKVRKRNYKVINKN
jgi:hypothetical protein